MRVIQGEEFDVYDSLSVHVRRAAYSEVRIVLRQKNFALPGGVHM